MLRNPVFTLRIKHLLASVLLLLLLPTLAAATGPRVTPGLFSSGLDEIYAVDFPPFVSSEIDGGGLHAEIVSAALKAGAVEAVVTSQPLPRMVVYYLSQEQCLAVFSSYLDLDAEAKKALIAIPIAVESDSFYAYRPTGTTPLNWDGKLAKLKGLAYGSYAGEELGPYRDAGIVDKALSPRFFLKELKAQTVDFVRVPALAAEWRINQDFPKEKSNFVRMEPPAGDRPVYLLFNSKHSKGEAAAAQFRKGLTTMIADGSYLAILSKYQPDAELRRVQLEKLQAELLKSAK